MLSDVYTCMSRCNSRCLDSRGNIIAVSVVHQIRLEYVCLLLDVYLTYLPKACQHIPQAAFPKPTLAGGESHKVGAATEKTRVPAFVFTRGI